MRVLRWMGLVALMGCESIKTPTDVFSGDAVFDGGATAMDAGPPIALPSDGSRPESSVSVEADAARTDAPTTRDAAPFALERCEGVPELGFGLVPVDGGHDWGRPVTTVVEGALRDIDVVVDLSACGGPGSTGAIARGTWKLDLGNIPGRVLCARLARVELQTPENYVAIRVGLTPASGGTAFDAGVTIPQSTFGSHHEAHEVCPWNCLFLPARVSVLVETDRGAAVVTGTGMARCAR